MGRDGLWPDADEEFLVSSKDLGGKVGFRQIFRARKWSGALRPFFRLTHHKANPSRALPPQLPSSISGSSFLPLSKWPIEAVHLCSMTISSTSKIH